MYRGRLLLEDEFSRRVRCDSLENGCSGDGCGHGG
jgi:hypothetical protein